MLLKKSVIFLAVGLVSMPAMTGEKGDFEVVVSRSDVTFTFDSVSNGTTTIPAVDFEHTVTQVGISKRTNDWFAFDLRYGSGGSTRGTYSDGSSTVFENDIGSMLSAYGRAHWPVTELVEPYVLIGFTQFDGDVKETGRTYGVGLNFRIADFGVRVESARMDAGIRSSAEATTLSVSYFF